MIRRPILVAALLLAPAAGFATTVRVTVDDVREARGHVRIGVCPQAQFLDEVCSYHAIVWARPGAVSVTIPDVPPGVYAVTAYQDLDDSGRLKRGFLGIPAEPIGFSRNPPMRMGPPRFADSALRIEGDIAAVSVTLRHR